MAEAVGLTFREGGSGGVSGRLASKSSSLGTRGAKGAVPKAGGLSGLVVSKIESSDGGSLSLGSGHTRRGSDTIGFSSGKIGFGSGRTGFGSGNTGLG